MTATTIKASTRNDNFMTNSSHKAEDPILTKDELYTEDGYPSAKLVTEMYKTLHETFGKIEIVEHGPSITDLLREIEERDSIPKPDS